MWRRKSIIIKDLSHVSWRRNRVVEGERQGRGAEKPESAREGGDRRAEWGRTQHERDVG